MFFRRGSWGGPKMVKKWVKKRPFLGGSRGSKNRQKLPKKPIFIKTPATSPPPKVEKKLDPRRGGDDFDTKTQSKKKIFPKIIKSACSPEKVL